MLRRLRWRLPTSQFSRSSLAPFDLPRATASTSLTRWCSSIIAGAAEIAASGTTHLAKAAGAQRPNDAQDLPTSAMAVTAATSCRLDAAVERRRQRCRADDLPPPDGNIAAAAAGVLADARRRHKILSTSHRSCGAPAVPQAAVAEAAASFTF